jgi:hypothetical protein
MAFFKGSSMPETPRRTRIVTLANCIDYLASTGEIAPPFTEAEREMAARIAEAWYFVQRQTELPGSGRMDSLEFQAFFWGIGGVLKRRDPSWHPSFDVPQW